MQLKSAVLGLALACCAVLPSAQAADYIRGPATYRSVPVPAPIPVPETFRWYVRADIGIGLGQEPSISERGLIYGDDPAPFDAVTPFGMSSTWFNGDFDTFFTGGIGAGIYLTPQFRADVTIDARTKADITGDHSGTYQNNNGDTVSFTSTDKTEVRAVVSLANLYWDFGRRGAGVTPYIGAGFGFAVRSMDRMHETIESDGVTAQIWGGQDKAHQVAPAAAAMAGFSYDISPGTILDINYRFLWMGGVDMSTRINGYESRLKIGDSIDHQIRAGLRWNVW
jgi:opacity protein-like surface antigen